MLDRHSFLTFHNSVTAIDFELIILIFPQVCIKNPNKEYYVC